MKRLDLPTAIIIFSLVVITGLLAFLFLQLSKSKGTSFNLDLPFSTQIRPSITKDSIITNPNPIFTAVGLVTKINQQDLTLFDMDRQISINFSTDSSTQVLLNKALPPYILGDAIDVQIADISAINVGDIIDVVSPSDITKPSQPAPVTKILIVQQLSLYTKGKVVSIDPTSNTFTINREDNLVKKNGVVVSATDVKKFIFGFTDEPDRNQREITIIDLKTGEDVLIYSETPIAPDATFIEAAYIKASQPSRPSTLDLGVSPTP